MAHESKLTTLANALDKAVIKASSTEARIEGLRAELMMHLSARLEKEADVTSISALVMASRLVDDYINLRPAMEKAGVVKSSEDFVKVLADAAPSFIEKSLSEVLLAKRNVERRKKDAASGIHRHN